METSFLYRLSSVLSVAITVYVWLIIIRVLLTWVRPNAQTPFMRYLSAVTDPALILAGRLFPLRLGGLDFSPVVLIIVLNLVGELLVAVLRCLALGMPMTFIPPYMGLRLIAMLQGLVYFLIILMIVRIVLNMVKASPYGVVSMFIYAATEPLLAPLRRWFPSAQGALDVRAVVFTVAAVLINYVVLATLYGILQQSVVGAVTSAAARGVF
ncbi:MAG: YggT family protein [Deltaproteobacteria bacterium]|jgi:YggT family protein|nr:YggT family protein [Deltaproteobacteria bacterium]